MEPRGILALVRSLPDLERACEELSDFLSLRCQRNPTAIPDTLLGIWVDTHLAANTPCTLRLREWPTARRTARIGETTGVSGIWMLCWLEVPTRARAPSRGELLGALLEASMYDREARQPWFVPVFPLYTPARDVNAEMQRLNTRYPNLLPPLYQDPSTGRLEMRAAYLPRRREPH